MILLIDVPLIIKLKCYVPIKVPRKLGIKRIVSNIHSTLVWFASHQYQICITSGTNLIHTFGIFYTFPYSIGPD